MFQHFLRNVREEQRFLFVQNSRYAVRAQESGSSLDRRRWALTGSFRAFPGSGIRT